MTCSDQGSILLDSSKKSNELLESIGDMNSNDVNNDLPIFSMAFGVPEDYTTGRGM